MLDWILVGLIVAVAAILLGRAMMRSIGDKRPTCACGHVDCPIVGECAHYPDDSPESRPVGCPLTQDEEGHSNPTPTSTH